MMLRFRLGSIPVHVHGFFFLTALLFGSQFGASTEEPALIAAWVLIMFVSVLLHELGHAVVGRAYGLTPAITLHGMGGTTSWLDSKRKGKLGHGARILISAAGPMFGLVTGGILWAVTRNVELAGLQQKAIGAALWINIGWSLINLVPILPLDGGQIMAATVGWISRDRWPRAPHILSIVVALPIVALCLMARELWILLLLGLFIYQNVRALDAHKQRKTEQADAQADESPRFDELAAGFRAIDEGDGHRAIRIAEQLLGQSRVREIRLGALRLLAYGRLLEGQWGPLMRLLEAAKIEIGSEELARFEQAAKELERPEEAAQIRQWLEALEGPQGATSFRA